MKKMLSEKQVKTAIINWLYRNGWGRNLKHGELRDKGVDIKVRHNNYARYFFIEVKGEKHAEVSFVYSLGQIITRMKTGKSRYYYGLGLAEKSAKIAMRRLPWQVAKKLLLYVFSVDKDKKVKRYYWFDLKKAQTKNTRK